MTRPRYGLAIVLWLMLALEAGVLAVLLVMWLKAGLSLWAGVALAIGIWGLWRALPPVFSFLLAGAHTNYPEVWRGLGVMGWLGELFGEIRAWIVAWGWLQLVPLAGRGDGRVKILLIHGYCCNSGVFRPLIIDLMRMDVPGGVTVSVADVDPLFAHPERDRRALTAHLRALGTKGDRVFVLGFSMGGVAARLLAAGDEAARIAGLISVATPFHPPRNAIKALARGPYEWWSSVSDLLATPLAMPMRRIDSRTDNIALDSAFMPVAGARSINTEGLGHMQMVLHPKGRALICDNMRAMIEG